MNAVIYARYSSDNQREESIDAQLRICHRYCQEHGYTVVHEYIDEAFTATNDHRPEYQQMFQDAKKGGFSVAVFHKVNRNARNEYDYYYHKMQLKRYGVSIEYAGQAFDTDTAEGQLMENQLVGMAAYFSRNLSREVKKGQHENAIKCVHNGGTPPLGYDVGADRHYVINEREAQMVRYIFSAYIAGDKYGDIIDECNRRGWRTKTGNEFRKNSVHDILANQKYAGYYIYGRTCGPRNEPRNNHRLNPDAYIVEDGMPAIVDKETWSKAQDRLKERKRPRGSYSAKYSYLLAGLVRCGACGARMEGSHYKRTYKGQTTCYEYYRCTKCEAKSIRKGVLEQFVIKTVKRAISSKRKIDALVKSINASIETNTNEHATEVKAINRELANMDKANANLLSLIEHGSISDIIEERLRANADKAKVLRARLNEISAYEHDKLNTDEVRAVLNAWKSVNDEEGLKAMLNSFVASVDVFSDRVDVHMYVSIDGVKYTSEKLDTSAYKSEI